MSAIADALPDAGVDEPSAFRVGATRYGRPWSVAYLRRLRVTDFASVVWAGVGAHTIAGGTFITRLSENPTDGRLILLTAGIALAWIFALSWSGARDPAEIGHGPEEYKRIVRATLGLFGGLAILSFVFDLALPRSYLLVMQPAGLLALLASRYTWRRWLHGQRRAGRLQSKLLVVGSEATVLELLADLRRAPLAGYRVIGVCLRRKASEPSMNLAGVPVLGDLHAVAEVAKRYRVDAVAVTATSDFGPTRVRRLSWELEDAPIRLVLAPALTNVAGPRIHTTPVGGLPLIHVDRPTYRGANRILKKSFDIVGAVLLLIVFSPLLFSLALTIKVTDRGPVFFRQERVGLNGSTFKMIKFRSMVTNAEELLADLRRASHDAGNEVMFKLKEDPRITRVGKFIRKYSLDELPQLLNVLRGEMSLVGPRPPLRAEVDMYADDAMLRLLVKPGMTGLWQVSGRANLTWEETVRLDVYYVENWSITSDLVILWKTAKAVIASSGAF